MPVFCHGTRPFCSVLELAGQNIGRDEVLGEEK
jgi:hypothetical protein